MSETALSAQALPQGFENLGILGRQGVIDLVVAEDVPVFKVGFGEVEAEDSGALAADTGGVFFESPASGNLKDTFQQIANLLFKDQCVLDYVSGGLPADSGKIKVSVEFEKLTGSAAILTGGSEKAVRACS